MIAGALCLLTAASARAGVLVQPGVPFTAAQLEAAIAVRGGPGADRLDLEVSSSRPGRLVLVTPGGRWEIEVGPAGGEAAARVVALYVIELGVDVIVPEVAAEAATPRTAEGSAPAASGARDHYRLALLGLGSRGMDAGDFAWTGGAIELTHIGPWIAGGGISWQYGLTIDRPPGKPIRAELIRARLVGGVALGPLELVAGGFAGRLFLDGGTVAANESVQLALGGAEVTLYGPGHLSPTSDGAVVDAAGIVIDRLRGDAPWSVHYHDARIVVLHATFAVEGGARTRVSVIRGEIALYCPSGMRTIRSGGSAACEPATEIRATPHHRPPGSVSGAHTLESQAPARSVLDPQAPAQQPTPAELYATAESALSRGDLDATQGALLAVVNASPDSLDAATALLDLARLAARRGDPGGALDYLARLDHHPRRAVLAAPAARLRETLLRSGSDRARGMP